MLNQIASKEEAMRSYDRLRATTKQFLDWDVDYLGSIAWDGTVGEATRRRVDFLTHYADAACTRDVRKLAARLISGGMGGDADVGRFFRQVMEGADG